MTYTKNPFCLGLRRFVRPKTKQLYNRVWINYNSCVENGSVVVSENAAYWIDNAIYAASGVWIPVFFYKTFEFTIRPFNSHRFSDCYFTIESENPQGLRSSLRFIITMLCVIEVSDARVLATNWQVYLTKWDLKFHLRLALSNKRGYPTPMQSYNRTCIFVLRYSAAETNHC